MKSKIIITSILLAAMVVSPLINYNKSISNSLQNEETTNSNYVSVMKTDNGKIEDVTIKEYLIGVLAAETDLNYSDEALKAQVMACHTYLLNQKLNNSENTTVDISDDPSTNQGYWNEKERKEKWSDKFDEKEKKAEKIVDSVLDEIIIYNNEPIKAVYFALSCGKTMSSKEVWDEDLPYLISVQSIYDKLSPDYTKPLFFTNEELLKIFNENNYNIKEINNISTKNNENGYITEVNINTIKISGNDFRKLLDLNSSVFDVEKKENGYTIKTYGYGHMVGMSQYGADYMAKQGADYKEILNHYYPNTDITEI